VVIMETLTSEQKRPTDIEVDVKQREVRITWADGYQSTYTFDYLRQICPCAVCNDQMVTTAELSEDNPVEMVGNYALQFFWADGHSTGIYAFDFLRRKSP
jgi:DUF971 family protein